jgi:hypothetical protein
MWRLALASVIYKAVALDLMLATVCRQLLRRSLQLSKSTLQANTSSILLVASLPDHEENFLSLVKLSIYVTDIDAFSL